ncbi:MAG: RsmE family RNA methyltransferase [Candidatus Limnocylindria bacterium]
MTVHRFFVALGDAAGDRFAIPAAIERQVLTVLRLRDGERIVLLTGDGSEILCRLDGGDCAVEERRPAIGEPAHRLTVVQALLKGDALEEVVQHATEVGVAAFRLVVTERSVARELSSRRLERLRAIARESAEQSERGIVPSIEPPAPLREALEPGSVLLLERHWGTRLGELPPPAAVIIGPEGGFTPAEVAAAEANGVTLGRLGPRILRAETVATAAAAVILSRTGDFA